MPKKKKTRQQKIQTDQRRQKLVSSPLVSSAAAVEHKDDTPEPVAPAQEGTFSLKGFNVKQQAPIQAVHSVRQISTNAYNYLSRDLLKTVFLTSTIVVAEILLKFFVERG